MRVVWGIDHLGYGGSQKALVSLVERLAPDVTSQAVVCFSAKVDLKLVERLAELGVPIHSIPKWRILLGSGIIELYKIFCSQRCDSVVSFLFFADLLCMPIAQLAKVPRRISSQRSSNDHYGWMHCALIHRALKASTAIVLNSSGLRPKVDRYLPENASVRVIPNGIDWRDRPVVNSRERIIGEIGVPADAILVGTAARLSFEKGVDVLIDGFAKLNKENTHLIIIGSGGKRRKLEKQVERNGLKQRVHFLGHRSDVPSILPCLQAYVQPSRFEGMPMALLEAMTSGCPVIATNVGGVPDLIGDNANGLLIETGDPDAIRIALEQVLDHPLRAARRARTARNFVREAHALTVTTENWREVLFDDHSLNVIG